MKIVFFTYSYSVDIFLRSIWGVNVNVWIRAYQWLWCTLDIFWITLPLLGRSHVQNASYLTPMYHHVWRTCQWQEAIQRLKITLQANIDPETWEIIAANWPSWDRTIQRENKAFQVQPCMKGLEEYCVLVFYRPIHL